MELAKPYDPVEFVVPEKHRFGPIVGIHIRRTEVPQAETRSWHGVRIARPARIALDLLLRLSPRKRSWVRRLRIGVPDLDAFLRAKLVRRRDLERLFMKRRNRGIRLARHALLLSDPRAESLPESELRIVLAAGGFAAKPQYNVRSRRGHFLGRLDLAIKESKVAIEYDGRWHEEPSQQQHDYERRRRIAEEGWRFVIVTAEQLATDFASILDAVRTAQQAQFAG
ncbi:endonuclease domain-containing protein [Amycolatopsis sp. NPDC059021]|uniref:endonuclease domain-containing protein n=1 Tax=Amycolatopsis sp. NPDC059021 TaxID=3346704 RepID=UPI003670B9A0